MDFKDKNIIYDGPTIDPFNDMWILKETYAVSINDEVRLECPRGMLTDGASIPRFFWRLIGHPMSVPAVYAAIIHDGGYAGYLKWYVRDDDGEWIRKVYTRKETDLLFRELLKDKGIWWWRRAAMYRAVRLFGASNWQER